MTPRARGVLLILLGGLCLSSGGVLIRTVEHLGPWTILAYRALGFVVLLLGLLIARYRHETLRAFRATGREGLIMALALGAGFSCYVFSMLMTTVANVSFIISSSPLFAAIIGWFVLRERVQPLTWLVIFGAAAGVGLMMSDDLDLGGMTGNLIALGLPLTFGVMLVMIRRAAAKDSARDMVPATCGGGMLAGFAALIMSDSLAVGWADFGILLWLGVGQLGLGFLFITMGTRHIRAAEAALLSLIESVLAPIWAWIFIDQTPGTLSLIGGVIVLGCVFVQGLHALLRGRRQPTA